VNPRLIRWTIVCLTAAALGLLVVPRLVRAARLHRAIHDLEGQVVPANVLRNRRSPGRDYVEIHRADLTQRLIATVAGDSPGRLGDLKIEESATEDAPDRVSFTVEGEASFSQLYHTLERLGGLWPAVQLANLELEDIPDGDGLRVSLMGSLAVQGYVPAAVALGEAVPVSDAPMRDPFRFGHEVATAGPSSFGEGPVEGAPAQESEPAFQGTGTLGGVPIAFFGGRAYRVGEFVAGRRLVAIEDGRALLAPAEDES
jgi:hypothetical protein